MKKEQIKKMEERDAAAMRASPANLASSPNGKPNEYGWSMKRVSLKKPSSKQQQPTQARR
jgi:hypothetical protein